MVENVFSKWFLEMYLRRYGQKKIFSKVIPKKRIFPRNVANFRSMDKKCVFQVISKKTIFENVFSKWFLEIMYLRRYGQKTTFLTWAQKTSFSSKYWYFRINGQKTVFSKWSQKTISFPRIAFSWILKYPEILVKKIFFNVI